MLGFCCLAPLGDALAKILGEDVPVPFLIFIRFGVQAAILLPLALLWRLQLRMTPRLFWLIGLRTILHITGIGAMFTSLKFLPLADAIAIAFVMPFIMLLLGKWVLHEEVGKYRLIACAVGFAGTLLVIQPNFAQVGPPALLPLLVAVVFALFMLVTRMVARQIDPIAMQAVSGVQALLILAPAAVLWPIVFDPGTALQDANTLLLLTALGLLGTFAHLLMTWSLRFAPSATLAPMQYLEIPIGTLIGWALFRDLPNALAGLGIAITIAAGLYVIMRERAIARRTIRQQSAASTQRAAE